MSLPSSSHPVWGDLVTGRKKLPMQLLAAKVLLVRLNLSTSKDGSPPNVTKCAGELHNLYVQSGNSPAAKADLNTFFGTR
jgi:hypothetical protein